MPKAGFDPSDQGLCLRLRNHWDFPLLLRIILVLMLDITSIVNVA